jgi:hypothetical protein
MRRLFVMALALSQVIPPAVSHATAIAFRDEASSLSKAEIVRTCTNTVAQDQQQAQTFHGQVVETKAGYALQTGSASYVLDSQAQAKQFAGKIVVVTGTVDTSSGILHVVTIELAV